MSIFGNLFKSYGKCAGCGRQLLKPGYADNPNPFGSQVKKLMKEYYSKQNDSILRNDTFALAYAKGELWKQEYIGSCINCGANYCRQCGVPRTLGGAQEDYCEKCKKNPSIN